MVSLYIGEFVNWWVLGLGFGSVLIGGFVNW